MVSSLAVYSLRYRTLLLRYCIPMDNDRPSLDLKHFPNICPDKNGMFKPHWSLRIELTWVIFPSTCYSSFYKIWSIQAQYQDAIRGWRSWPTGRSSTRHRGGKCVQSILFGQSWQTPTICSFGEWDFLLTNSYPSQILFCRNAQVGSKVYCPYWGDC